MYILVIARGYMSAKDPVLGNFEAEQAWALKRLGHKVVFMSVDRRPKVNHWRKPGFSKLVDCTGMPVYNFFLQLFTSVRKRNPLIPFVISDKIYEWSMMKLYKKVEKEHGRPDVIYSHYLYNSYMAIKLKTELGIPMVAIEHWSEINNDVLRKRVRNMGNAVYYSVDSVISVSKATSVRLKQHFNINSPVIFNMIDTTSFCYTEKKKSDIFKFVTLGQNVHRKGFDVLVNAFTKAGFLENVELYFIGIGDWTDIKHLIQRNGLDKQIKVLGPIVERADLVKVMQGCDAFVLPSRKETFSVVCVEALSLGLPVIATPCGGPEEYINETNGILVPIEDDVALAKAMKQMIEEYDKYDRKKVSENIKHIYSPEVIARQVENILKEAIK